MSEKSVDNVTFRRYVATLREECSVDNAEITVVRRANVYLGHHKAFGYTCVGETRDEGKIRILSIVIDMHATEAETQDTLIHEWAHAMTGDLLHSDAWGVAYAKCYRAFHDAS